MILSMMQPYFLPYLGYYALIRHSDTFVIFDEAQYIRHGWMDRNRILHPNESWQYIKVPLRKASHNNKANERFARHREWGPRILRQLEHYKNRASHYAAVIDLLRTAFETAPKRLDQLNTHLLERTCAYLGLESNLIMGTSVDFERTNTGAGEWALKTASALGADVYLNPEDGRDLFDPAQWRAAGIEQLFLRQPEIPYQQKGGPFEPHLSVVDAMMFNTPERVVEILDAAELCE